MEDKLFLKDEAATQALGRQLADELGAGDVVLLEGELGAGKSTLARALIRALGTQSMHIPSPTFTIVQAYEDTRLPVAHVDGYRLGSPEELEMVGLEEVLQEGVIIMEWPPAGFGHVKAGAGTIRIVLSEKESGRLAEISRVGRWGG